MAADAARPAGTLPARRSRSVTRAASSTMSPAAAPTTSGRGKPVSVTAATGTPAAGSPAPPPVAALGTARGAAALAGGGADRPVRGADAAPPEGDRYTTSEQE
ncbi:hypothetical protein AB0F68_15130 [Micromonospora sp. NPDC023966]|uniref:hypothetical protein n=1 Tax=Micromonospora sp. NPDC023966 TaxID=3154699 RepID=UPI0033C2A848